MSNIEYLLEKSPKKIPTKANAFFFKYNNSLLGKMMLFNDKAVLIITNAILPVEVLNTRIEKKEANSSFKASAEKKTLPKSARSSEPYLTSALPTPASLARLRKAAMLSEIMRMPYCSLGITLALRNV